MYSSTCVERENRACIGSIVQGIVSRPKKKIAFGDLVVSNIVPPGSKVRFRKFLGEVLPDGSIRSQDTGKDYTSLSAFATELARLARKNSGTACNGWSLVYFGEEPLDYYRELLLRDLPEVTVVPPDRTVKRPLSRAEDPPSSDTPKRRRFTPSAPDLSEKPATRSAPIALIKKTAKQKSTEDTDSTSRAHTRTTLTRSDSNIARAVNVSVNALPVLCPPGLTAESSLVGEYCVECGTAGADEFINVCSQCGEGYHCYCISNDTDCVRSLHECVRNVGWQCASCLVCEECKHGTDPDKLVVCDRCDRAFHTACMQPPMLEMPSESEPWYCRPCQKCISCGRPDAQRVADPGFPFLLCDSCCRRRENGEFCALCDRGESRSSRLRRDAEWLQCDGCDVWVHAFCAGVLCGLKEYKKEYYCVECVDYQQQTKKEIEHLPESQLTAVRVVTKRPPKKVKSVPSPKPDARPFVAPFELLPGVGAPRGDRVLQPIAPVNNSLPVSIIGGWRMDGVFECQRDPSLVYAQPEYQHYLQQVYYQNYGQFQYQLQPTREAFYSPNAWPLTKPALPQAIPSADLSTCKNGGIPLLSDEMCPAVGFLSKESGTLLDSKDNHSDVLSTQDTRQCWLCKIFGDQRSDYEGRLVCFSPKADRWVHVYCLLWSSQLKNVPPEDLGYLWTSTMSGASKVLSHRESTMDGACLDATRVDSSEGVDKCHALRKLLLFLRRDESRVCSLLPCFIEPYANLGRSCVLIAKNQTQRSSVPGQFDEPVRIVSITAVRAKPQRCS